MVAAQIGRGREAAPHGPEIVKDYLIHEAVLARFTQHADLREILLKTGRLSHPWRATSL